jgi:hypothetical protein
MAAASGRDARRATSRATAAPDFTEFMARPPEEAKHRRAGKSGHWRMTYPRQAKAKRKVIPAS